LKNRGLIREGYFADITIFDPQTVIDRATFEEPNQYPVGINFVIVNGQIEVDNGQRTPALAGRVLRGPGYCPANRTPTLCDPPVSNTMRP
jgi:N-acyl-D-aspartate/D-glutamate deacylase